MSAVPGEFPAAPRSGAMSARLARRRARVIKERAIEALLFLAALVSLSHSVGIVYVLVKESVVFFQQVSIADFLTDRQWTPLFDDAPLRHPGAAVRYAHELHGRARHRDPTRHLIAIYLSEFAAFKLREIAKALPRAAGRRARPSSTASSRLLFVTRSCNGSYPPCPASPALGRIVRAS
jgi:phosphate transport system permease protein